jgi:4-amino-4-deoxy-L-arabinose transferase-like glycosyltransferase
MRDAVPLVPPPCLTLARAGSSLVCAREDRGGGWLRRFSPYVLLCLLCLILYAPGLVAIPPVDRDEARFAQSTRQMLETGDFIRIRFQEEARNKKPIGIYWLQAGAVALLSTPESTAIWPYRLPSAMAATIAVLLMSTLGVAFLSSRRAGLVAAFVMAAALGLVVEAHLAKADAALLGAVMTGQLALGLVYVGSRDGRPVHWRLAVVFWLAEAAGILLKGPPAPALALVTVTTLSIADRDIRWIKALRPTFGLVLMGLIVSPWFVAIEEASAGSFLAVAFRNDFLSKLVSAQESHGAPPGAYVAVSLASFRPGSLFLVPALIWGWQGRRAPPRRFLLAWLAPAWLVVELMPTKLPNYVLPLYPALALLVGGPLTAGDRFPLTGFAQLIDATAKVLWGRSRSPWLPRW